MKKKIILAATVLLISAMAATSYLLFFGSDKASAPAGPGKSQETVSGIPNTQNPMEKTGSENGQSDFNKNQYSLSEPTSPWVVVNKLRPLPSSYVPQLKSVAGGQMRPEAADALSSLLAAAQNQGLGMQILSSYRSYSTQASTYQGWVARDGQAQADTYSARPGHSEHQTGLAVDLGTGTCNLETCFGNTPSGKWLAANAYKYGFIIRYLQNKDSVTGYQYEPWHLRYTGKELASQIHTSGKTMEEFFGLPAAPNYN